MAADGKEEEFISNLLGGSVDVAEVTIEQKGADLLCISGKKLDLLHDNDTSGEGGYA